MGQYHILYNLDNGEWVTPHKIGLGLKQVEHTQTVASLSDVLYILLTASAARGGGDLDTEGERNDEGGFEAFGRWVGDRVVVLGDYTEDGDIPNVPNAGELWGVANDHEELDITDKLLPAFETAFGVKIGMKTGWRDRKLDPAEWGWLLPNLEDKA